MRDDAVYLYCPRWLEESGLPEVLNRQIAPGAWSVFKRLAEADVEANLLPDWFSIVPADLAAWTGIEMSEVESILQGLEAGGYINRKAVVAGAESCRIRIAPTLPLPLSQEEIQKRLKEHGWRLERLHWRYLEPPRLRKPEKKVLHLYQQYFGMTRMNDRIAADLVEMARTFDYNEIKEAFEEARQREIKTLNWIVCRLYRGMEDDEQIPKSRRGDGRKKSARKSAAGG